LLTVWASSRLLRLVRSSWASSLQGRGTGECVKGGEEGELGREGGREGREGVGMREGEREGGWVGGVTGCLEA
jgi:hypothetical protein